MRVKIFTAPTMQEAMAQVKGELGIDAVILHTRRFHKGGFLGYLGKEMVEVTAAVEDAPLAAPAPAPAQVSSPIVPKSMVKKYAEPMAIAQESAEAAPEAEAGPETSELSNKEALAQEAAQQQRIQELQRELDSMKLLLERVMSETPQARVETVSLYDALVEQEISERTARQIVATVSDPEVLENKDLPEAANYLEMYFDRTLKKASGIVLEPGKTKVVALIGATGVGKTTTVAKLAANFVLEKGCSVALITADTYRISAVEQLRTYSDIIGIPLEIVYATTDLETAIEKHRDKDLILIDTAGRSQHNAFQLGELKDLFAIQEKIEKHLVLSATTKFKDAADVIRKFSICVPDKILFTKVDETSAAGLIVETLLQYPLTPSYFTNGQSVPDDIVLANARNLAELLLR